MIVDSLWYLIFIPAMSEAAVTAFTSIPSSPLFAIETHDLTLMWNYTLDGSVLLATFSNVTGGGSDEIARKVQDGSISVKNNYQVRFSASISGTHAWLKIRRVQRSDQGRYQFSMTATGSGTVINVVEVIVQSVTSLTSNPSSPLFAIETNDLTLIWNYTLDGSVLLAIFSNVTGGGSDVIARKVQGGSISVDYKYSDRFSADISETHAWLNIRRVQRSDQGTYQFYLSATGSGTVTNVVEVIVQYCHEPEDCSSLVDFTGGGEALMKYCTQWKDDKAVIPGLLWSAKRLAAFHVPNLHRLILSR